MFGNKGFVVVVVVVVTRGHVEHSTAHDWWLIFCRVSANGWVRLLRPPHCVFISSELGLQYYWTWASMGLTLDTILLQRYY